MNLPNPVALDRVFEYFYIHNPELSIQTQNTIGKIVPDVDVQSQLMANSFLEFWVYLRCQVSRLA